MVPVSVIKLSVASEWLHLESKSKIHDEELKAFSYSNVNYLIDMKKFDWDSHVFTDNLQFKEMLLICNSNVL